MILWLNNILWDQMVMLHSVDQDKSYNMSPLGGLVPVLKHFRLVIWNVLPPSDTKPSYHSKFTTNFGPNFVILI